MENIVRKGEIACHKQLQATSPFLTMFSTLYGTYFSFQVYCKMSPAIWIRRLINSESKCTNIAKMYIDSNLLPFCGKIFYEVVSNKCSNKFWAETFKSISKLIEAKGEHIAEYPVLYFGNISWLQGYFFKSWFDAGIMCIRDFLSDNGPSPGGSVVSVLDS